MRNRITILKEKMLNEKRYASIEQARIITRIYKENETLSVPMKRALSLKAALEEIEIGVEKEELIVGNRTKGVRAGVVFPESGCSWVDKEFETLPTRPQDRFEVRNEDIKEFRETIYPYWKGHSMEDVIRTRYGKEIDHISKVVKINQKDHAQGHICPDSALWLKYGPQGLLDKINEKQETEFYTCTKLVLEGAIIFMKRYRYLLCFHKATILYSKFPHCLLLFAIEAGDLLDSVILFHMHQLNCLQNLISVFHSICLHTTAQIYCIRMNSPDGYFQIICTQSSCQEKRSVYLRDQ